MDLGLLYGNFVMYDQEFILHSTPDGPSVFRDDKGITHCAITSFQHADPDIERDPLSINRRLFGSDGIELFGTMVVVGPSQEVIYVLVPDSTTCTADVISPSDLQHVVGLRLGTAENLSACVPREDLHMSLCDNSLRPTLTADRKAYWTEVTPLLRKWKDVNDSACPHCHKVIRVNMSRHLRAAHTDNQCFWRCPVSTCPLWFNSELNGKDHLERIHSFREGQGCSFYECLKSYGLECFGRRSFFDQRERTGQAMWMDFSLACQSGQDLTNHYITLLTIIFW